MSERSPVRRSLGPVGITLYVLAFSLLVAAAVCLFYGALGSSLRLVWSSIVLSGLAMGTAVASVFARER